MNTKRFAVTATLALLGLILALLCGQAAASEDGPPPLRPAFDRTEIAGPNDLALQAGPRSIPFLQSVNPGYTVDLVYDAVWGLVHPGDTVTINRVADGAYGAAEADGQGFFWTPLWQANGQPADIQGGDTLQVYVDGGLDATIPVAGLSGGLNVLTDQAVGTISGDTGGTLVTATADLSGATDGEYPGAGPPQTTATTNASGSFTAAFAEDLGAGSFVAIDYPSGGHTLRTYLYPNPHVFYVQNLNQVLGYADPGQQVDVTVYEGAGPGVRWSASGSASAPHGFYNIQRPGQTASTQPGDLVEVDLGGGPVLSTVVADMTVASVDTVLDRVAGTAPSGATVVVRMWPLEGYAQAVTTASGGGTFTADLSGVADLRPRHPFRLVVADAQGDETQLLSGAPYLTAILEPYSTWDCVLWRVDAPFMPVTLTLQTATGVYTRETHPTSDAGNTGSGYCYLVWGPDWGPIDFAAGDTVTLRSPTWEGSLVIPDISWAVDTASDQVRGQAPSGELEVDVRQWYADQYPIHGSAVQTTTAASPYVAAFTGFDVRDGGTVGVRHYDPTTDFSAWYGAWGSVQYQYFAVEPPHSAQGMPPNADEVVTATLYTADGVELASTSEDWDEDPWRFALDFLSYEVDILPGHWLTVTSESGWEAGLQIPTLTVEADAGTNLIWGEGPKARVMVEHDWDGGGERRWVPVDGYVLDRAYYGGDIQMGDNIHVQYEAPSGDRVRIGLLWPWMFVNYGEDEAGGVYDVGHTFWITVTDSGGTPRATATVSTEWSGGGPDGIWENGFTVAGGAWSPAKPDIRPGDWVHFQSDDGYNNSVRVGTITGGIHSEDDTVSGAIEVPWLAMQTLEVGVGGWGFPGFRTDSVDLDAAGRGEYFVDFSPTDLPPDISLGVWYEEPDADRVYNIVDAIWEIYLPLLLKNYTP